VRGPFQQSRERQVGLALVSALSVSVAGCLGSKPNAAVAEGGADEAAAAKPSELDAVFKRRQGEWPMWGGTPSRNMHNPWEKGIPHEWDVKAGKNIKWTAALGSQSYGNPVVYGGKIFVGTNNEGKRNPKIEGDKGIVMCFNEADGQFLWQAVHDKLSAGRVNDWPEQGICSSPVAEDGKIYYVSNRAELVCADVQGFLDGENDGPYQAEKYTSSIDGDCFWVYDMIEELGVFPHNLATCSPLIAGNLVYVMTSNGVEKDHITIPSPRSPSFIAVHKVTGELVWESNAPGEAILHGQWSSPSYGVAGGQPQVVFAAGNGWLYSFEPLKGELLWQFDCNPKDAVWKLGGLGTRNYIIATPVFVDGRVYIAVGQDPEHGEGLGHLYAINAVGAKGDVSGTAQVWHVGGKEFGRTLATAAVYEDLVFDADLAGFLYCFDRQTGKQHWAHDMLAAVWGSPTVIDGKVFLGDEDGDVVVLKAAKTKDLLAEMNLDNSVYTTPVAAKGVLYIVNRTTLFAIAAGAKSAGDAK
jgi:outer membrane protein assembly factor BamB